DCLRNQRSILVILALRFPFDSTCIAKFLIVTLLAFIIAKINCEKIAIRAGCQEKNLYNDACSASMFIVPPLLEQQRNTSNIEALLQLLFKGPIAKSVGYYESKYITGIELTIDGGILAGSSARPSKGE